jgi:hypothetical protein
MIRYTLHFACIAVVASATAAAQDVSGQPFAGEVRLSAGFQPDPHTVDVIASGSRSASALGAGCAGMISNRPDYRLRYTAGSLPLIFSAQGSVDLTLVINAPDGQYYCDDDSGPGNNPQYTFSNPQSGAYEVWVGTYSRSSDYPRATLSISELRTGSVTPPSQLCPSCSPNFNSYQFRSNNPTGPISAQVVSGGSINARSVVGGECLGWVSSSPDIVVNYTAGLKRIQFQGFASEDTTLVIQGPNGSYYCDDDRGDGNNPRVIMAAGMSGRYAVWVGSYSQGDNTSSTVVVSDID